MSDQPLKGIVRPSDTRPNMIDYVEDGRVIPFHLTITDRNGWADGCRDGDIFATLSPPSDDDWQQKYAWAKSHREEITALVIEHARKGLPPSKVAHGEWGLIRFERMETMYSPGSRRVIKTARTVEAINAGVKNGFRPLVKWIEPSEDVHRMIAVFQNPETGEVQTSGDFEEILNGSLKLL